MSELPPFSSTSSGPDPRDVAAQAAWLRRLALAIARDANDADDLAQETMAIALRRPPSADVPLAAWLADVTKKLALFRRRGDARRGERERRSARRDVEPREQGDPALAVERLELQEALLRAVKELREPYRTAILLRWFEGLEPAEIAARSGESVRTVHTRLARGLELLRERLGARTDEGRARWTSAWIPVLVHDASKPASVATPTFVVSSLAMNVKLKLVLSAVVLAGAACLWILARPAPPIGAPSDALAPRAVAELSGVERTELAAANEATRASEAAAATATKPVEPARAKPRLLGRVLDERGNGVATSLAFVPTAKDRVTTLGRIESDAGGRFDVDDPSTPGTLAPRDERWTAVLEPRIEAPAGDAEYRLVVAPRIAIAGRVVDEHAAPVAEAEVELAPADVRAKLGVVLDTAALRSWKARTDDAGRFAFPEAPSVEGSALWASATGYQRTRVDAPVATTSALELVLAPSDPSSTVHGRVVDANGAPIAGAHVALDREAVLTDRMGRFELAAGPHDDRTGAGGGTLLRAVKKGFLPVKLACAKPAPNEPGAWPEPLVIVLAEPARAIEGVVVDENEVPLAGVRVTPLDRTHFADVQTAYGAQSFALATDVEVLMGSGERKAAVTSDANGRFELAGLLARDYRLRVFDPRSLAVAAVGPFAAGQKGVRVVLPIGERIARVAGRVVDRSGRPTASATVTLAPSLGARADLPPEETYDLASSAVKTDAEGRFEFSNVARACRVAAATTSGLMESVVELSQAKDVESIVLVLARDGHVRIESKKEELEGTSFSFLDEKGEPLVVYVGLGDVRAGGARFAWSGEASAAITVSETARALVFYDAEEREVLRVDVRVSPDEELTILRP